MIYDISVNRKNQLHESYGYELLKSTFTLCRGKRQSGSSKFQLYYNHSVSFILLIKLIKNTKCSIATRHPFSKPEQIDFNFDKDPLLFFVSQTQLPQRFGTSFFMMTTSAFQINHLQITDFFRADTFISLNHCTD